MLGLGDLAGRTPADAPRPADAPLGPLTPSRRSVSGPAIPSACDPLQPWACWKAATAAVVWAPYLPVAPAGIEYPLLISACLEPCRLLGGQGAGRRRPLEEGRGDARPGAEPRPGVVLGRDGCTLAVLAKVDVDVGGVRITAVGDRCPSGGPAPDLAVMDHVPDARVADDRGQECCNVDAGGGDVDGVDRTACSDSGTVPGADRVVTVGPGRVPGVADDPVAAAAASRPPGVDLLAQRDQRGCGEPRDQ